MARDMICLDTNYLILGLVPGSSESQELLAWVSAGELLIVPAPVWYEFVCGPVTAAQIAAIKALLHDVVPFGEWHATEAARLFNTAGRKRALRVDAMVAATAIVSGATLATNNLSDFTPFISAGLKLTAHLTPLP